MPWEYKIVNGSVKDTANLQNTLNIDGGMNWEAVGAFASLGEAVVILKREKESAQTTEAPRGLK